jgi:acyl carrier protein
MELCKMSLKDRVYKILADAVRETVEEIPSEEEIQIKPDLLLVGLDSQLDSLGLVSLVVTAETKLQHEFGVSVALVDDDVMDNQDSSLRTLENLTDHVTELLKSQGIDEG